MVAMAMARMPTVTLTVTVANLPEDPDAMPLHRMEEWRTGRLRRTESTLPR